MEENERLIKLFESMTPGGSEFYNDPDRCYKFVTARLSTMGKVAAERNALRAENERLRERVATLQNALETRLPQAEKRIKELEEAPPTE